MFHCFFAEPCFDDSEALDTDAFLHLSKMSLGGCLVLVSAGFSEVFVSSEAFDEVFDVWYLFELSCHEGAEVPDWVVLDWSAWAFCV